MTCLMFNRLTPRKLLEILLSCSSLVATCESLATQNLLTQTCGSFKGWSLWQGVQSEAAAAADWQLDEGVESDDDYIDVPPRAVSRQPPPPPRSPIPHRSAKCHVHPIPQHVRSPAEGSHESLETLHRPLAPKLRGVIKLITVSSGMICQLNSASAAVAF